MLPAIVIQLVTTGPDAVYGPRWLVCREGEQNSPNLLTAGVGPYDYSTVLEHVEHMLRLDMSKAV